MLVHLICPLVLIYSSNSSKHLRYHSIALSHSLPAMCWSFPTRGGWPCKAYQSNLKSLAVSTTAPQRGKGRGTEHNLKQVDLHKQKMII